MENDNETYMTELGYRQYMQRALAKIVDFKISVFTENSSQHTQNSSNSSEANTHMVYSFPVLIAVCTALSIIIVATIIGNIFVISAILLEKTLQAASNYLILSLAVADLMVAILVMPISIVNEIHTTWILGAAICDMWVSFDILCCTSSILHLVAIALDRYWSVTNVDYTRKRSPMRILVMIFLVWFVSFSVSVPPLLGWRQPSNSSFNTSDCMISQDIGYTIYSTFGAFYIPLMLILALNYKIYVVARSRFQRCLEKKGILRAALQAQRASITMLVRDPPCEPSQGVDVTNYKSDTSILKHTRVPQKLPPNALHVHEPKLLISPSFEIEEPSNAGDNLDDTIDRRQREDSKSASSSRSSLNTPTEKTIPHSSTKFLDPKTYLAPPIGRKPSAIISDPISSAIEASVIIQSEGPSSTRDTTQLRTSIVISNDTCNTDPELQEGYLLIPGVPSAKAQGGKLRRIIIPEIKKEKRTASVLGIITGAFILCWLPFFVIALVGPLCGEICDLPRSVLSLVLWLGYFNSMINPIVYTIFNPNFRVAFRKLYCSGSKHIRYPKASKQL